MATLNVTLIHGLKIGESVFKNAVIREATAGDYLECQEQSEKVVFIPANPNEPAEPVFVSSPALMSSLMLCRQIKSIDDHSGPLDITELKSLHPVDLNLLMTATETLLTSDVNALSKEVAERGRQSSSGETE